MNWWEGHQTTCDAPACSRRTALVVLYGNNLVACFCRGHRHRKRQLAAVKAEHVVTKSKR